MTSPKSAPRNRNDTNTVSSISDRSRISRFTPAIRRSCTRSNTRVQSRQAGTRNDARQNHRPSASPDHSAMKVAQATPVTPQSSPSTNHRSSPILSPFIATWMASTAPVRSCAISQPVTPYIAISAGPLHTRIAM